METTDHIDALADGVLGCTLPKAAWDHEAHLTFGYAMVRTHGVTDALPIVRAAIRRYNESTGTANTDDSGYHETLTAFYCGAVAHLQAEGASLEEVLAHPLATRGAPLGFWERERLMATPARLAWLAPQGRLPFDTAYVAGS